ncbi:MAG: hypothetical protein JNK65_02185 [Deltaproteobacteria bacterium]|nr:hypothetical protein [Deltaproteobacteria bacterium]
MRNFFKSFLSLSCLSLVLAACGSSGGGNQMSGIVAEAKYETVACQPKSKLINIRNDDTTQPQRIQGIHFEGGTNDKSYFKLDKVTFGDTEIKAQSNKVEEVIIPAGGVLAVQATYNPKEVTAGGSHVSYLDFFMNGPKLGIMQVKLDGKAETALEGCTAGGTGDENSFKVKKITVTVKAAGLPGGEFKTETPEAEVTKPFKFKVDGTKANLAKDDFPPFDIKGSAIPGGKLPVKLADDVTGTFESKKLDFTTISFSASGIEVSGKMSTGTISADGQGPSPQNISLTGSNLADDGKMKVVFVGALPADVPAEQLKGGVVGVEFELEKQ